MLPPPLKEISSSVASLICPPPRFHVCTHSYRLPPNINSPPQRVQRRPVRRRGIDYLLATLSNDAPPPTPEIIPPPDPEITPQEDFGDLARLLHELGVRLLVVGIRVYFFFYLFRKKRLIHLLLLMGETLEEIIDKGGLENVLESHPRILKAYQQIFNKCFNRAKEFLELPPLKQLLADPPVLALLFGEVMLRYSVLGIRVYFFIYLIQEKCKFILLLLILESIEEVYLTIWLAEPNIDTYRVGDIISIIGEEMHVKLS